MKYSRKELQSPACIYGIVLGQSHDLTFSTVKTEIHPSPTQQDMILTVLRGSTWFKALDTGDIIKSSISSVALQMME